MSLVPPALCLDMFSLSIAISLVLCPTEFCVQFPSFSTLLFILKIASKVPVTFQIYLPRSCILRCSK